MIHPKKILRITLVASGIIGTLIFTPWQILRIWITPLPDSIQEQVQEATGSGLDGIIVYVDQRGKPPAFYASGWMDKGNKIKVAPDALFKIASISKLYLAVATTKLVANSSLSLDDTLSGLLPELKSRIENAGHITLRTLLTHRSGIPDWIDDKAFPWDSPPKDVDDVLSLVFDDEANFQPDARYQYSNTNYLLIGKILDKTLGYGHQEYIKKEILDRLGLMHTYGSLSDANPGKVMCGYDSHYEGDVKGLDFVSPSGAMVATAEDVGIFLRALNDGSLLNDEEMNIYSSVYEFGHTGLLPGYMSIARYHKDIDSVVVQFVNTSGGNSWGKSETIYNRIVRILRNAL